MGRLIWLGLGTAIGFALGPLVLPVGLGGLVIWGLGRRRQPTTAATPAPRPQPERRPIRWVGPVTLDRRVHMAVVEQRNREHLERCLLQVHDDPQAPGRGT